MEELTKNINIYNKQYLYDTVSFFSVGGVNFER